MNKEELMGKELCNLYAIAKQVNLYFDENKADFLSEKGNAVFQQYRAFSQHNEEQVMQALRNLKINPGNTVDSIVMEMIENLEDIASGNMYDKDVRSMGYIMSLNRLVSYHAANIQNLEYGTLNL